jgi:hypothetical protein
LGNVGILWRLGKGLASREDEMTSRPRASPTARDCAPRSWQRRMFGDTCAMQGACRTCFCITGNDVCSICLDVQGKWRRDMSTREKKIYIHIYFFLHVLVKISYNNYLLILYNGTYCCYSYTSIYNKV